MHTGKILDLKTGRLDLSGLNISWLYVLVLSSKNFIGMFTVPRAFFNACLFVTLYQSYRSAGGDFAESPLAGVFYTVVCVYLMYKRVCRTKQWRVMNLLDWTMKTLIKDISTVIALFLLSYLSFNMGSMFLAVLFGIGGAELLSLTPIS